MATSAKTLTTIIEMLSKKYKFDYDKATDFLAKEELLPKKMITNVTPSDIVWASKKAEDLASRNGFVPTGIGSGKNGKWTLSDVEKATNKPTKTKLNASADASNLAKEYKLSIDGKTGSGKNGRILVKDVEKWIDEIEEDGEEIIISSRARQLAQEYGITDAVLSTIKGSGHGSRILLKDINDYQKNSGESEEESEEEDE